MMAVCRWVSSCCRFSLVSLFYVFFLFFFRYSSFVFVFVLFLFFSSPSSSSLPPPGPRMRIHGCPYSSPIPPYLSFLFLLPI
ncbi:MAG: hypothetical protein J3Q66DRAFT_343479 [Benniella sp.]|nr:MAG: hypothetical protein J3Q66DRAFT_343479 [Benniella sp.]